MTTPPGSAAGYVTGLRFARRELRGGLAGFRVFLACLAVGVGAIAAIGSISKAVETGLKADARVLLGGDVELRMVHRAAPAPALPEDILRNSRARYVEAYHRLVPADKRVLEIS